ncbi:ProQ-like, activator of ProP osmoprotectant transporter [Legionella lansingensis]|uniref:ProQ-like, activator of ProP osmoprotectant transporter n=1 Tax=Legionella lansingensis TaxID=45067 RepID=A0A0W0VGI7_9GAMM|nr:ProQ/FinO family protein [Legionella lansingensis]KTD19268.1 ProQ-like, activator of ProP osmoprotectant transporter [Legionella lansingensis]SNV50558.1 ProQ-like, activator of ProP osmoprotectant transporter [Legionella lansingensis]
MNQQHESAKKDKLQIIDWLIEHFPGAFFKKGNQVKPLQIGIFDEIIDFYERLDTPPFSKKALREALSYYSSSPAYLNCQKPNAARVDLYGNEVDVVTEEQAKYAHQRYQQRYGDKKAQALKQEIK